MKKHFLMLTLMCVLATTGCSGVSETLSPLSGMSEPKLSEEELAALRREEQLLPLLNEAENLALGYYYEEALSILQTVPEEFTEDAAVTAARSEYTEKMHGFVPYEEPVRHIFFHSLIVDPALAFDGDHMSNGYNYWMTTVDEFKAMLRELYQNNYVLIDIHDLATESMDENGNKVFTANAPLVPEGKRPLVLSVDDVNYYEYMKEDGFARKLLIDENGDVKNLYVDKNGNELIGDYDVVPILDSFIKEHPDFSLRGAKGIIALTGYEGTMGYRTNDTESPTYEQDKLDAKAVADRMKETGWLFAVHGWGHRSAATISLSHLSQDTARWKEEVGSLVGDTDIYIYPYGEEIDYPSDKLTYLNEEGYHYFCGVWTKPFVSVKDTYVRQTRCNLDGYNMITRPGSFEDLFDSSKVLDPNRPELE